jgi:electron-transferring-flavoprotein dehydrogenase
MGEVPIAIVEKGKGFGYLLSGAVMKPGPLRELFPDMAREDFPADAVYGEVTGKSVYFMTKGQALRIPTPPQCANHGNWVISVSQLARWMSSQAREARRLPAARDRRPAPARGRRPGDGGGHRRQEGAARRRRSSRTSSPGVEAPRPGDRAGRGTQGHLSQVARSQFEADDSTQTWELGVKEVWQVPSPSTA